jgi:hypothetical protein
MTDAPELIKELRQAHAGHADEASSTFSEAADLLEELQRDRDRLDWILDNASIRGGGDGFTIKVFVPVDCECVRTGIDLVMEEKHD